MTVVDTPTRRRWFQFGIGTMLLAVVVVALSAFGIKQYLQAQREREPVQIGRVGIWESDTVARELKAAGIGWGSQGSGQSELLIVSRKDAERAVKILRDAGVQLREQDSVRR